MSNGSIVNIKDLERIIYSGGDLLVKFWNKRSKLKIDYKQGQGLVSKADKEVEKYLVDSLKKLAPNANFCAEESSFDNDFDQQKLMHGASWMIDPLDGTSNFLSGFDYFSISVAFCMNGLPEIGIVYRPIRGDFFIAFKNGGAFYENKKDGTSRVSLNTSQPRPELLSDSLLCTGFAGEKGIKFDQEFEVFKNMMKASRGVRRLGSAALDLCYLAKGSWHGFWEKGLAPWDVAAGALICEEAGLDVFCLDGQSFSPFSSSIIACSPSLKVELLSRLKS
jgi:myo-inositol-1(or 4)-monophosphatase